MQEITGHIKSENWMQWKDVCNHVFMFFVGVIFKKTLEVNCVFVYSKLIAG